MVVTLFDDSHVFQLINTGCMRLNWTYEKFTTDSILGLFEILESISGKDLEYVNILYTGNPNKVFSTRQIDNIESFFSSTDFIIGYVTFNIKYLIENEVYYTTPNSKAVRISMAVSRIRMKLMQYLVKTYDKIFTNFIDDPDVDDDLIETIFS